MQSWCTSMPYGFMGEDEYIDKCMQKIGAQAVNDFELVGDHRCMSAECSDTNRPAFHDYKTVAAYSGCYKTSINAEKAYQKALESQKKYKTRGAFCCTAGSGADKCSTCFPSSKNVPGT